MDVRIFEVLVDPSKEMEHLEGVKNVSQALKREMKSPNGWKAYPEMKRCNKCHLNETCPQRALLPKIKQVFN
jgi:predicted RecB family nuclease